MMRGLVGARGGKKEEEARRERSGSSEAKVDVSWLGEMLVVVDGGVVG